MSSSEHLILKVKKLVAHAELPQRGSKHAAGYDLYSAEDTIVLAKNKQLISSGIAIAVPEGHYGRMAPRSGLAAKHFIDVGAGVIDCDYRGEIKILLFNFSDEDFHVKQGERIAQLIIEKIAMPELQEVESLEDTTRGEGGFGSTGLKKIE